MSSNLSLGIAKSIIQSNENNFLSSTWSAFNELPGWQRGFLVILISIPIRKALGGQGFLAFEPGKKCEACKSFIPADAIKCKYCGSDFPNS